MPVTQLHNKAGVWGADVTTMEGQGYTEPMVAATAVTAKTIVALSTTAGQVVPCATNQDLGAVVGIAVNGAAAGGIVNVLLIGSIYGVAKSTAAADNFAQFDRVTFSATTTAAAALLSDATAVTQIKDVGVIGVALAAATTGATTMNVMIRRI